MAQEYSFNDVQINSTDIHVRKIHLEDLWQSLREGYDDFNFLYLYRRELFADMPIDSDGVFMCTEIFVRAVERGARVASVEASCLPRVAGESRVFRPTVIAKTMFEMGRFWMRRRRSQ